MLDGDEICRLGYTMRSRDVSRDTVRLDNFLGKIRAAVGLLALLVATAIFAEPAETVFARVAEDDERQPLALQLAIVTYVPEDRRQRYSVDLVSAIHIADPSYYADLNQRFEKYDALLYELVAPRGTIVEPDSDRPKGLVSSTQLMLTRMLDLSFQLDEVDYTQANFVHADLSATELRQSMADRDESLYTYFWRIFFATMREYGKDPLGLRDLKMMSSMLKSDQDASFKIMFAYEMTNMDSLNDIFGEDSDSAIIGARNERAIEVLRNELDSGAKRLGIFYGVAHMPDIEERLLEMGLVPIKTTWVDAWNLGSAAPD